MNEWIFSPTVKRRQVQISYVFGQLDAIMAIIFKKDLLCRVGIYFL